MKQPYIVEAEYPTVSGLGSWDYADDYFPRKVHYLKEAQQIAKDALAKGAATAKVKYPDGRFVVLKRRS